MSNPRCNLTPEEREHAFGLFTWPYLEELNAAKRFFKKYIFFETWGRRNFREYFCPECGQFEIVRGRHLDVYQDDAFNDHHGDMIQCPQCGTEGELICLGRMKTMESLHQEQPVVIFREAEGALIAMAGYMNMQYTFNDLDPYPAWVPTKRYFFAPGKRMEWSQRTYNWFGKYRFAEQEENPWTERSTISEPFPCGGYYYGGYGSTDYYGLIGVNEIHKTSLRYSMMEEYFLGSGADQALTGNVIRYLGEYTRRPQLEMLVKLGHTDVIRDLLNGNAHIGTVNWKAKTPNRFFRLDKQDYKAFAAAGGTAEDLEAWKHTLPYMHLEEYLRLKKIFGGHLAQFLGQYGEDPRREKLAKWFSGQVKRDTDKAWNWWRDLLTMEAKLGNDISHDDVLMPKDLWRRHDEAAELFNAVKAKRDQELISTYGKKRFRELKKRYAYTDGTLSIVIPTCAEEIENEGKLLRHCVGGYAKRHIKGIKTIVFLRWRDDIHTPYMTIEIRDGCEIQQIHGYKNEVTGKTMRPMDIHGEFLDEWLTWIDQGSPRTSTGKPIRPRTNSEEAIAV